MYPHPVKRILRALAGVATVLSPSLLDSSALTPRTDIKRVYLLNLSSLYSYYSLYSSLY